MKNQNLIQSISFIVMLLGFATIVAGLISNIQLIGVIGLVLSLGSITVNVLVSNFKTVKS